MAIILDNSSIRKRRAFSSQLFTSSGSWTRPAGVNWVYLIMVGGGGGSTKGWNNAGGHGGGSGSFAMGFYAVSGSSVAVTIGAGGTAGGDCGGNGGTTSFGAIATEIGGYGGNHNEGWATGGPTVAGDGGGGGGGGGSVNENGCPGGPGGSHGQSSKNGGIGGRGQMWIPSPNTDLWKILFDPLDSQIQDAMTKITYTPGPGGTYGVANGNLSGGGGGGGSVAYGSQTGAGAAGANYSANGNAAAANTGGGGGGGGAANMAGAAGGSGYCVVLWYA